MLVGYEQGCFLAPEKLTFFRCNFYLSAVLGPAQEFSLIFLSVLLIAVRKRLSLFSPHFTYRTFLFPLEEDFLLMPPDL